MQPIIPTTGIPPQTTTIYIQPPSTTTSNESPMTSTSMITSSDSEIPTTTFGSETGDEPRTFWPGLSSFESSSGRLDSNDVLLYGAIGAVVLSVLIVIILVLGIGLFCELC